MHVNSANVNTGKHTMMLLLNIAIIILTLQRETFIRLQMKRNKMQLEGCANPFAF